MKYFLPLSILVLLAAPALAQVPEQQPESPIITTTNTGTIIFGKLVDKTGKPIPGASVQLYPGNADSLFDGMLTKGNGEFRFQRLPTTDSIRLLISASRVRNCNAAHGFR